jgi:hypothetical protein
LINAEIVIFSVDVVRLLCWYLTFQADDGWGGLNLDGPLD